MAEDQPCAEGRRGRIPMEIGIAIRVAILLVCMVSPCALVYVMTHPLTPFPQIIGHNCGTAISTGTQTWDLDQGKFCLWQAYTTCETSTLVFTFHGVDTSDTLVITVQPRSGGCAVTVTSQGEPVRRWPAITTVTCTGIQQKTGGLLLTACGQDGDLYLPPRPTEQVGHVCGMLWDENHAVTAAYPDNQNSAAGIEDCFWQAYSSCARPTTLVFYNLITRSSGTTGFDTHTLIAQESEGLCTLTDVVARDVTYTCASLARTADGGLIMQGCGKEGDIIIPPAPPQST